MIGFVFADESEAKTFVKKVTKQNNQKACESWCQIIPISRRLMFCSQILVLVLAEEKETC